MDRPSPNKLSNPPPGAPASITDEDQTFATTLPPRLLLVMLPESATPGTLLAMTVGSVCLSLPLSLLRDYGEGVQCGG